ncbi:MAG: (E)-4-hydroxy-3-methylbut-2-enyl-diphosphate synthase [Bacteroidales bacterium]
MGKLSSYARRLTREVNIGGLALGGMNPIRVQSMTNTDTLDTRATVSQAIRMIHAGCEYVRITAPGLKEAENLTDIKEELRRQGYRSPLIADIHFNPKVALEAARRVEKIRINPGNYADKKTFKTLTYSETEYQLELQRIAERLHPLLKVCKEYGTVIRIGTNHGSLSDRIMSRYGDTPEGMAESAMEFIRICDALGFQDLVLSMKSSNIKVSAYATRLLVFKMQEEGYYFPLHLGITEAGEGEDGRVKSAAGIGALLEDGIGDTIRVSLTEAPERELPVARALAGRYNRRNGPFTETLEKPFGISYFSFQRRETHPVSHAGGGQSPVVVTTCLGKAGIDCHYFNPRVLRPDFIYDAPGVTRYEHPETVRVINHIREYDPKNKKIHPFVEAENFSSLFPIDLKQAWVNLGDFQWKEETARLVRQNCDTVIVLHKTQKSNIHLLRQFISFLIQHNCKSPIILRLDYPTLDIDHFILNTATDAGFLLADGLIDGLWLEWDPEVSCKLPTMGAFNILQASGDRLTRTEYISCPSCGRTQFDIEEVLASVKERTSHLTGLKIAVMGCIVNGPGEMADAHYGYVGAGIGKVNLYKGKELVKPNINEEKALEELIRLIKESGDWKESTFPL